MLIKGASREIKDDDGNKVVDMIDDSVGISKREELELILGK